MKSINVRLFKDEKGFTLVETLIVISIMMILSTILLTASRTSNDQIALSTDQATLAGALNRAKSLALTKWVPSGGQSACGFGIHFDAANGAFVLYQDLPTSSNPCGTVGGVDHNYVYAPNSGEDIQTFALDKRIEFETTRLPDIVFVAPYLNTFGAGTITIRLKSDTNRTANVEVTSGGSVSAI